MPNSKCRAVLSWSRARNLAACSSTLLLYQIAALAQTPSLATSPSSGISLADAVAAAQSASPTLAAAQARFDAAQARLRGAAARVVPQLILARAFGHDTGGFDEDITLSQTFELGKRAPRLRSARALGTVAGFERGASAVELKFAVSSAYFEALRAQSELDLSQGALQTTLAFDRAAKIQLQAGDVPRANVVRSEIEVERARQALSDAQTERDNRFATLASLLGPTSNRGATTNSATNGAAQSSNATSATAANATTANATTANATATSATAASATAASATATNGISTRRVPAVDSLQIGSSDVGLDVDAAQNPGANARLQLKDSLGFTPVEYDEATLQTLALTQRADLAGARALQDARAADIDVARSIGKPDAFLEARRAAIARYSGLPQGQSIRVGVSFPLGDFGARRASIAEAEAAQREGAATLQETQRAARLEVSTSLARLQNAARSVRSFQNGRSNRSRELLDMAQIGYERGANSYLELLDAQNVFRTEQSAYARALTDWNIARVTLERAVGGQLP